MTVLTAFAELAQVSSVYVPGLELRARFKRVAASWLALKTWVKVWLTFLNVLLFAGFGFLDDPLALWTLASLPVTGVLLVGMALAMGGLNRLVGLGHLMSGMWCAGGAASVMCSARKLPTRLARRAFRRRWWTGKLGHADQ